jgi:hypothetical protein
MKATMNFAALVKIMGQKIQVGQHVLRVHVHDAGPGDGINVTLHSGPAESKNDRFRPVQHQELYNPFFFKKGLPVQRAQSLEVGGAMIVTVSSERRLDQPHCIRQAEIRALGFKGDLSAEVEVGPRRIWRNKFVDLGIWYGFRYQCQSGLAFCASRGAMQNFARVGQAPG